MIGRIYFQTRQLDASLFDALLRLFVREPNRRESAHLQVERALGDPSAIEAALTTLAPDVLCALSVAIDAGGLVPRALLLGELQRALGDRAAPALTALATTGLMTTGSNGERLGVLEWVAEALTWFVPAIEPARDVAPGEPEPLRFDTAVLLALLADTRPRVNRDGGINATDLRRLDKRLAATPRLTARIDAFVDGLIDAHTLRLGDRVELDSVGVLRHFTLPLADSWGQLVRRQLSSWQMYRAYTLCAAAGARWLPAASLERIVRLRTHFYGGNRGATPDLTPFTQSLLLEQTIDGDGDGGRWFRAPQLPAPEAGKLVVQPSFEVLAPPNTPPAVIAQLGRFAKLQHADRFATFRVDEDSVLTATDEGFTAEALIALLTAHAEHALPQNVAVTIRSWTRAPKRAVLCAGLAVQLDSAEQQTSALAALRRENIAVTELGERVLVVPEYERSRVKALLRKLAVRVVDRDPLHGNRDREDEYSARRSAFVDERGERYHAPEAASRLQARLRARMTEEPAPPAGTKDPAPPVRTKEPSSPTRAKDAPARAKETSARAATGTKETQASRMAAGTKRTQASRELPVATEDATATAALLATLEHAAESGETLLVRARDYARVVRVERLRQRGGTIYAEMIRVDRDQGFTLPLADILAVLPLPLQS